ncbi:MAG: hypothetical protein N2B03_06285, partial [Boseongicola sp.]
LVQVSLFVAAGWATPLNLNISDWQPNDASRQNHNDQNGRFGARFAWVRWTSPGVRQIKMA